jgi:lysyl-tRNA synthetase class 2
MPIAQSNHLQAFDYDDQRRVLTIQFTNGSVYNYAGVDPQTYADLSKASSPGSFFHSKIKGAFKSTLIATGVGNKRRK